MLQVEHKPLREIVYDTLKLRILTGEIKPGERLMEIDLSEDMGVSRTPIREAIRILEEEGLVTIEPRRGAYASEVSLKEMVDALELRQEIEGLAAYLAAGRMGEADKQRIYDEAIAFKEAVASGDSIGMINHDTAFHHIIAEATGNKMLVKMVEQLQDHVLRFRHIYYSDFKRAELMPEEHREIKEAILAHKAEEARAAAEVHISRLKELVLTEGV